MARRYVFNDDDLPDDPPAAPQPRASRRQSALEQIAEQQREVDRANELLQMMRRSPAEFIRQVRRILDQEDAGNAMGPYDDGFYAGNAYEPFVQKALNRSTVTISREQIERSKNDGRGAFAAAMEAELRSIAEGARREEERRMLEQERINGLLLGEEPPERMNVSAGGTTLVVDRATLEQYRQLVEPDKRYEPEAREPGLIYKAFDELAPLPEPKYLYDPSKAQVEFLDRKAEDDRVLRRLQMAEEQRLRALELLASQRRRARSP